MGKSNGAEIELGIGGHVQLSIPTFQKRTMTQWLGLNNRYSDVYRKHGALRSEYFQLEGNET